MDGDQRRSQIIAMLESSDAPISGSEFAKRLGVSRQVVVQDMALLRAGNKNILATNKGYIYFSPNLKKKYQCCVKVSHDTQAIRDEFDAVLSAGAKVLDVTVEHSIYGSISMDLLIESMEDAEEFVRRIEIGDTRPLKELTGDVHFHTLEADTQEALDAAVENLRVKGFLKEE